MARLADLVKAWESATGRILGPGETMHVNHGECPAGTDTRERLYITRKLSDGGSAGLLAYCHNCGEGFHENEGPAYARGIRGHGPGHATPTDPLDLVPPPLVTPAEPGFPIAALEFLAPIFHPSTLMPDGTPFGCTGVLTRDDVAKLGIGYNRETSRLLLPIYATMSMPTFGRGVDPKAHADTLLGWQERRLFGAGPKYITTDNGSPMESLLRFGTVPTKCIVIVEDYLSALRAASCAPGFVAAPLLRYKSRAEWIATLTKYKLPIIVWLDNDRPEVGREADHLVRLVKSLGGAVSLCPYKEPKKLAGGVTELKGRLEEHEKLALDSVTTTLKPFVPSFPVFTPGGPGGSAGGAGPMIVAPAKSVKKSPPIASEYAKKYADEMEKVLRADLEMKRLTFPREALELESKAVDATKVKS